MEDSMDAPRCWKSEKILVDMGPGREPIDIVPYLADPDDDVQTAARLRLEPRLVFCDKMYPPSWNAQKKIVDAVKNAVAKVDNVNLNIYGTRPKTTQPFVTLSCDMSRTYRPPKNPDEIQATVYESKEELPRVDKAGIRKDRMVNKNGGNRPEGQSKKRRTYTEKMPPGELCSFRIKIILDPEVCWHILSGSGCRCHTFHPKRTTSAKRRRMDTFTEKERDDAAIFTRQGSAGVGVGILKEQTGTILSQSQLLYNKNQNEIKTGHVPPPAPGDIPGVGSTAEQCIRYLEKERQEGKKSFIALYHSVQLSTLLTIKKKRQAKASKGRKAGPLPAAVGNQEDGESEPTEQERTAEPLPAADHTQNDQNSEPTESTTAAMVMEVESCDANGIRSQKVCFRSSMNVSKLDRRFCLLSSGCEQTSNAFSSYTLKC
jgi:hypothetical protein